ncbi:lactonase family protein [Seonamhaeicola sp. ML3]|uniref:lactonase family protein n=1 Tax=Seonamhaeicola sp. ML3 TaxID=2937786 RepID=UPI00200BDFCD|nr:lactonase family protein [Seonamhaeicola sp. ML3]
MNKVVFAGAILLLGLFFHSCKTKETNTKTLMFVGSFTDKKPGEGIYVYEFDDENGKAELKSTVDSLTNSSFLELSPNGKYIYSVLDAQMPYNGKVGAFEIDAENAKLNLLNIQDCGGLNPAHLEVSKSGKLLVNSNYSDGSLSLFKIKENGTLEAYSQVLHFKDSSLIKSRQEASHIHSANFSPDGNYVFAHDLGADKIRGFSLLNTEDSLALTNQKDIKTKLGSGPRHFSFHPNGKFGYLANELSGRVDVYQYIKGDLVFVEDNLSYGQQQDIYRTADIHISPDGKFLYVSNRGPEEDTITVFKINEDNGKLTLVERVDTGGKHPRNFAIHPSGKYLLVANMFTDNIVVFKRDQDAGKLTKLDEEIKVKTPSSVQIRTYKHY